MRSLLQTIVLIICALSSPALAQRNLGEPFVFENEAGRSMPYRLFTPDAAATSDNPLPLVVFLHGAGERGTDNQLQVQFHINGLIQATQSVEFSSYLLAPQVPPRLSWSADGRTDLTIEIIESLAGNLPIDRDRIYVTGLSMGGFGSFEYLQRFPDTFAAAVPMSGGGDPGSADRIRHVPVWMFHGDRDGTVSPDGSRVMYSALRTANASPMLTEIAGGNHVIWSPIYDDARRSVYGMYEWMFSQNRANRQPTTPLISFGDEWTYLDDGSDQGTEWRNSGFDDSTWARGAGPFGFGDGDETTVLACGPADPDCSETYATYYFRRDFSVDDPSALSSALAQIVRDDGVSVYLNGEQVFRETHVRTGFDEFARTSSLDDGFAAFRIDPAQLLPTNTLAVEVHQSRSRTEIDLSFDLQLVAEPVPEPAGCLMAWLAILCVGCFRARRTAATPMARDGS